MINKIAFIDLDNCLANCNLSEVLLQKLLQGHILPQEALYITALLKVIENRDKGIDLKEMFQMAYSMCAGLKEDVVKSLAESIIPFIIKQLLKKEMLEIVDWHRRQNHHLVLLSCSTDYLVKPLARELGFHDAFGLTQQVNAGVFTGKISGITNGLKKTELIVYYSLNHQVELEKVYLYTDSYDDECALKIVGNPIAAYPDPLLEKLAKKNRWEILNSEESFKQSMLEKIVILSASSGGGHNAVAELIKKQLLQILPNYHPVIVKMDEEHILGKYMNELYNYLAQNSPALYSIYHQVLNQPGMQNNGWMALQMEIICRKFLKKYEPRAIISVHSSGSQMAPIIKKLAPDIPIATCVTDWFGNCLLNWGNSAVDFIYSPSKRNAEYLMEKAKTPIEKIIVGNPVFSEQKVISPDRINLYKEAMQLRPEFLTILFNSYGNEQLLPLLEMLNGHFLPVQIIALAHKNPTVYKKLIDISQQSSTKIIPILWSEEMDKLQAVSDVVFTKPGPLMLADNLSAHRLILINHLQSFMPQEEEIVHFLNEKKLVQIIHQPNDWKTWLKKICENDAEVQEWKSRVDQFKIENGLSQFCKEFSKLVK